MSNCLYARSKLQTVSISFYKLYKLDYDCQSAWPGSQPVPAATPGDPSYGLEAWRSGQVISCKLRFYQKSCFCLSSVSIDSFSSDCLALPEEENGLNAVKPSETLKHTLFSPCLETMQRASGRCAQRVMGVIAPSMLNYEDQCENVSKIGVNLLLFPQ